MPNLTPTEIYYRLDALVARTPSPADFGLELMEAVGAPPASITRARKEAEAGSFAWTRMLTYQAVEAGNATASLERMIAEADSKPKSRRPRLLVAYDGEAVAARDTKMGDTLSVALDLLPPEAEFFFPLGGLERYVPAPECEFRGKSATCSDAFRPPVPTDGGHPFRSKPATAEVS